MKIILVVFLVFAYVQSKKNSYRKSRLHKHLSKEEKALPEIKERFEEMEEHLGKIDFLNMESFKQLFRNRGMIPGEIDFLFTTIDMKKENKISQVEWASFFKVFIEPFEKCDTDKTYLMKAEEVGKCLEEEELSALQMKPEDSVLLFELINKSEDNLFNFADYMFLRRVNIGWGDCAGGTLMSRIQIPCGMRIVVPNFIASESDVKMITDIVSSFQVGSTNIDPYLHLNDYIQTSFIYYYFYAFQIPYINRLINKKDMKRAVDYQTVSIGLNNKVINQIFGESEELNLKNFAVSLIIYQYFKRFAKAGPGLSEEEFLACLKQVTFSAAFLKTVNNIYIPTQEEYDSASKRPDPKYNERDFLVNFMQIQSSYKKHRNNKDQIRSKISKTSKKSNSLSNLRFKTKKDDVSYDEDKQKLIYRQFEFKNAQNMDFTHFMRWFKWTWMFINYDTDKNNLLTYQEIRAGIESYECPLSLTLEETQWVQWACDFVANPTLNEFDLKQWYAMGEFHDVFNYHKSFAFTSFISEAKIMLAMYQLGFRTTTTILDESKQGKDPTTGVPLYNYWTAFKEAVKEEIICQKEHDYEEIKKMVEETIK